MKPSLPILAALFAASVFLSRGTCAPAVLTGTSADAPDNALIRILPGDPTSTQSWRYYSNPTSGPDRQRDLGQTFTVTVSADVTSSAFVFRVSSANAAALVPPAGGAAR